MSDRGCHLCALALGLSQYGSKAEIISAFGAKLMSGSHLIKLPLIPVIVCIPAASQKCRLGGSGEAASLRQSNLESKPENLSKMGARA